ncbi:MAG: tRNA uridine-5-carboxymethylaminomethyl(34) synthesis GTPase MnmE [Candidatus Dasytiphilus stammeri]
MKFNETIVSQATPPGRGGISIVRVSGRHTTLVAHKVLGLLPSASRKANYREFYDEQGNIIDKGMVLWFPAPNSFTGEDVLEFHCHGSPIIVDILLKRITTISQVRLAKPGEFTERAFFNKKLDLTQAEAIEDLINATNQETARAAFNSLQGKFSNLIYSLVAVVTDLRVKLESNIDFPNENVYNVNITDIENQLNNILIQLNEVHNNSFQGSIIRDSKRVLILGNPNVGKSSLFNVLTGHDTAIVTDVAGTTRDVLQEIINLDGISIKIIDTAGIHKTNNIIEQIGIARAWEQTKIADHIIFMVDSRENDQSRQTIKNFLDQYSNKVPVTIVKNKIDLIDMPAQITEFIGQTVISISVLTGEGIKLLCNHIKQNLIVNSVSEGNFLARQRHLQSLKKAIHYIENGKKIFFTTHCEELLAEELRWCHQALNEITGEYTTEDLLTQIFSSFCIGK